MEKSLLKKVEEILKTNEVWKTLSKNQFYEDERNNQYDIIRRLLQSNKNICSFEHIELKAYKMPRFSKPRNPLGSSSDNAFPDNDLERRMWLLLVHKLIGISFKTRPGNGGQSIFCFVYSRPGRPLPKLLIKVSYSLYTSIQHKVPMEHMIVPLAYLKR